MKRAVAWVIFVLLVTEGAVSGWATETGGAVPPTKASARPVIAYHPPKRGKPGVRIGGGSRGVTGEGVALTAIVPDHVALSATATPLLCWRQSGPASKGRVLVLDDGQGVKPFVEEEIKEPNREGIQCVGLARFGVTLQPEIEYHWYIIVINDPDHRSKDTVSGGAFTVKAPSVDLVERIEAVSPHELPSIWAEEGYWHDAVASVVAALARQPTDPRHRAMMASLLWQVGLPVD